MANRESTDTTSGSGKAYVAGQGATTKNVFISKDQVRSTQSLLATSNAHALEVHADNAVFDTVSGTFLFPGRDFSPGDLQRK